MRPGAVSSAVNSASHVLLDEIFSTHVLTSIIDGTRHPCGARPRASPGLDQGSRNCRHVFRRHVELENRSRRISSVAPSSLLENRVHFVWRAAAKTRWTCHSVSIPLIQKARDQECRLDHRPGPRRRHERRQGHVRRHAQQLLTAKNSLTSEYIRN
jgi:hypothetical protein